MKTLLLLLALLPVTAHAEDFTYADVVGDFRMGVDLGIGNLMPGDFWTSNPDLLQLDSFGFWVTDSNVGDLTYRAAVGMMNDRGQWSGDVFSTDWQTVTADGSTHLVTTSTGGLQLDPLNQYIFYLLPAAAEGWSIQTTANNLFPLIGSEIQFYTDSHLIDRDLPFDRDVAMQASMSQVPEPTTLMMMATGLLIATVSRRLAARNATPLTGYSGTGGGAVFPDCERAAILQSHPRRHAS